MCSIFRLYNIDVIFVFDGKPGDEKQAEIQQRREDRYNKWVQYDELKAKKNLTDKEKTQLYKLKRTLTKINGRYRKTKNFRQLQNIYKPR